jgi:hypothetical protein
VAKKKGGARSWGRKIVPKNEEVEEGHDLAEEKREGWPV